MSLAEEAREAARDRPFLLAALRAGVANYAAAARALDVSEDTDAVATALRRFAEDLPDPDPAERDVRVTMHGGLAPADGDPLLSVNGEGYAAGDGPLTGVLAAGEVDAPALAHALGVLGAHGVAVRAAGVAGDGLVVVVDRQDGAAAVRHVERALGAVPTV